MTGYNHWNQPEGMHSGWEVCDLSGLTFRDLDYIIRTGRFSPAIPAQGSGSARFFSPEDLTALQAIKARRDWGMELDAALRHEDPPLPPPPLRPTSIGTTFTAPALEGDLC